MHGSFKHFKLSYGLVGFFFNSEQRAALKHAVSTIIGCDVTVELGSSAFESVTGLTISCTVAANSEEHSASPREPSSDSKGSGMTVLWNLEEHPLV